MTTKLLNWSENNYTNDDSTFRFSYGVDIDNDGGDITDNSDSNDIDDDTERDPDYGHCPRCVKANNWEAWCNPCDRKALADKFHTWSTGNKNLDLFIQETQRTATSYGYYYGYLECVPYDRFADVRPIARGGLAEVFAATWLDGKRDTKHYNGELVKARSKPFTVALKIITDSAETEQSLTNELKLHYEFYQRGDFLNQHCPCYGITQDPETLDYALILRYFPNGDLREILANPIELTWEKKLKQLSNICKNLKGIHKDGYIHRNIHGGNILFVEDDCYLIDFGLTPDSPRSSTKAGTYGVIPYMAPELFLGEPHSRASDIYAFGIIMSEIASNELAFYDRDHDVRLQSEITYGLRPEVPPETPECYKRLMDWCLSGNPLDRPTVEELDLFWWKWYDDLRCNRDTNEAIQFRAADEQWKPRKPKKRHLGAVYTSRLITHM